MNLHVKLPAALWALCLLGMLYGCGDNGAGPEPTAAELTAQGWTDFEAGEYHEALSHFEGGIGKDSDYGEAYTGMGWCFVGLDSLDSALGAFDTAISKGVLSGDARAGRAIVYRDLKPVDLLAAVDWSNSALSINPRYVFSHDTTFDWHDLRLILAHSYFELSRYDEAKAQVDVLNPANTLDPAAETFVEDLLAEIQRLGAEF